MFIVHGQRGHIQGASATTNKIPIPLLTGLALGTEAGAVQPPQEEAASRSRDLASVLEVTGQTIEKWQKAHEALPLCEPVWVRCRTSLCTEQAAPTLNPNQSRTGSLIGRFPWCLVAL